MNFDFLKTLGKTINTGLDIGLRMLLPDLIEEQVIDIKDTIIENGFGEVPKEIENLCLLAYLRNLAGRFDVKKVRINNNDFFVELEKKENIVDSRLASGFDKFKARLAFDKAIKIKFDGSNLDIKEKVKKLIDYFTFASLQNEN